MRGKTYSDFTLGVNCCLDSFVTYNNVKAEKIMSKNRNYQSHTVHSRKVTRGSDGLIVNESDITENNKHVGSFNTVFPPVV